MKIAIPCALLTVLACSLSAVAAAADFNDELPKRVVNFADLDLSSNDGAAVLYRRIKTAAHQVCVAVDVPSVQSPTPARRCADQALERAVAQVNAPALNSLYRARTGRTVSIATDLTSR